jgi:hypothetical protein
MAFPSTQKLVPTDFTRTAQSLHFYDSMLVIEKRPMDRPSHMSSGVERIQPYKAPIQRSFAESITNWWLKKTAPYF